MATAPIEMPTPSAAAPLAVDARRVAELLGVSLSHIRRMDSSGKLPRPIRMGHAVRWSYEDLTEWIRAGCPERDAWDCQRRRRRGR
ncbi:MAG: hypothetical protein AMXMBFR13_47490 [Phycisphaerae bacterium]